MGKRRTEGYWFWHQFIDCDDYDKLLDIHCPREHVPRTNLCELETLYQIKNTDCDIFETLLRLSESLMVKTYHLLNQNFYLQDASTTRLESA